MLISAYAFSFEDENFYNTKLTPAGYYFYDKTGRKQSLPFGMLVCLVKKGSQVDRNIQRLMYVLRQRDALKNKLSAMKGKRINDIVVPDEEFEPVYVPK